VLSSDMKEGLYYRCVECGGKGIAVHGGLAALFDIGSGCRYDANWESNELLEERAGIYAYEKLSKENNICQHHCELNSCACDSHHADHFCKQYCNGTRIVEADDDFSGDQESDDSSWDPGNVPGGDSDGGEDELVDSVNDSDGDQMDLESVGDISSDSDDDDSHNDDDVDIPTRVKFYDDACDNCHRKAMEQRNSSGQIDCDRSVRLRVVWLTSGAFQRRASTMKFSAARAAATEVNPGYYKQKSVRMQLCQQCRNGLTIQPSMIVEKDIWPAMMWTWLTDRSLLRRFGSDLWKIVPAEWRRWWIRAVLDCIPQFHHVTVENPLPIFSDVTDRKENSKKVLRRCALLRCGECVTSICCLLSDVPGVVRSIFTSAVHCRSIWLSGKFLDRQLHLFTVERNMHVVGQLKWRGWIMIMPMWITFRACWETELGG